MEFAEGDGEMGNNPNQVESTNEEGITKKAEEETEKNEEKLAKATCCETEEGATDEERNGPYRLWTERQEGVGQDQAS